MKIAYVLAEFPSLTETFILREMVALASLGVDLTICALRRGESGVAHDEARIFLKRTVYPPARSPAKVVTTGLRNLPYVSQKGTILRSLVGGPGVCGPATFMKRLLNFPAALWFAAECRRQDIEHIHAHFAYLTSDVAAIMSLLCGIPMSISTHAWDIYTQSPRLTKARVQRAAFVACCTEDAQRLLTGWLPDMASRFFLIRHGLPLDLYRPGAGERSALIVAIGRLVPKKGFCHLVEACALLREKQVEFHCTIVGEGPLHGRLERLIARRQLVGKVRLVGTLNQSAIRRLLASASVLVAPSIVAPNGDRDGLPNAVLEALALETPVVVTSACAAQEIIVDGRNGFVVPPGSPEAVARKVEELLRHPERRAAMGRAGRESVEANFDVQKNTSKLLNLFRAVREGPVLTQP